METLKRLVNPVYQIKDSRIVAQCEQMRVVDQTLAPGKVEFRPLPKLETRSS